MRFTLILTYKQKSLINKMIENLLFWIKTPLGEEVFFMFLLPFISSVLILWVASKIFKFKRNSFLIALMIGYPYVITDFLIRLINILFSVSDSQKPPINITAMIISNVLLIILIVLVYKLNWWKTILTWLIVYFGKLFFVSMVVLLIFLTIPSFREFDSAPIMKPGLNDFTLPYAKEVREEIGTNHFIIYKSIIKKPYSTRVINLASSVAFNTRVENVSMDMKCLLGGNIFIESMKDKEDMYEFSSVSQPGLDFGVIKNGYARFGCAEVCSKDKTIFHPENLGKKEGYIENVDVAKMNTGEFMGARVLFVDERKPINISIDFPIQGEDSATINCDFYIFTEKPSETIKKSFTIEYIAD